MKTKIAVLVLITLTCNLCACNNIANTQKNNITSIVEFSDDKFSIRKSELEYTKEESEEDNKESTNIEHSEIFIKGENEQAVYEVIDNKHIKYNGTMYNNLYTNVNSMETPCKKEQFINFIVKTYTNKTNSTINTVLTSDNSGLYEENEQFAGDSQGKTIAEGLREVWPKYNSIRNKYGTDVKYQLLLYQGANNNMATLYTCKEYIIYRGNSGDMVVDIDKLGGENDEE